MPLYSEEIRDIMGRIPGWILRVGLSIILGIFILLLVGSYFFKYPEKVTTEIILTTLNPPLELYVKSSGKIDKLFFKEGDSIRNGQTIAVIQNTTNYESSLELKEELHKLESMELWDEVVMNAEPKVIFALGDLQSSYTLLYKLMSNFSYYLQQNYIPLKIKILEEQIKRREENYKDLLIQKEFYDQDFQLAESQFKRDSTFFFKNKDAMSILEYEKITQNYLQKKTSYLSFCSSVKNTANEILNLQENILDLEMQLEQELKNYRLELDEAYRFLLEAYSRWKETYILESQIDGLVTFSGYWSENQFINSGERVVTIVPHEETQVIGRTYIDMNSIGKVEKGQQVHIKLHGFPYMQHGLIKGVINNISLVPEKGRGYPAEILLTEGMESSYREELNFYYEMEGIAEIITKDSRLITRLLEPLKLTLGE